MMLNAKLLSFTRVLFIGKMLLPGCSSYFGGLATIMEGLPMRTKKILIVQMANTESLMVNITKPSTEH